MAIAVGITDDVIRVIGGNQDDSVSIKNIPRSRLLGMRVPKGYAGPVMKSLSDLKVSKEGKEQ